jgi:hypothetical protein
MRERENWSTEKIVGPPRAFVVTVLRHRPGSGRSTITPSAPLGIWKNTLACPGDVKSSRQLQGAMGRWFSLGPRDRSLFTESHEKLKVHGQETGCHS